MVRSSLYLVFIVAIISALLLAILLAPKGGTGVDVGSVAMDISAVDIDGNAFVLSDQRGSVVLIDWMGVNCPPCRTQMPELAELHEAYGSRGLTMISLDISDFGGGLAARNEAQAEAFLAEFGASWPIALERTGLATRYRVVMIPTIMIVDPAGAIAFKEAGLHTFETLQQVIAQFLPT